MTTTDDPKGQTETIIDLNPDDVVETRPESNPEMPPAKTKPRGGNALLWGALAVAVGAVGGGWIYRDYLSDYLPSDQMTKIIERTEAMETGNASLREQLATLDKLSTQFKTDIDALETSVNTANSSAKSASDSVFSMGTRVDQVDKALQELRTTQEELRGVVAKLQSGVVPQSGVSPEPATDLSEITERLAFLEKEVASLKAGTGVGGGDLAVLSQSLSDLKAKFASGAPFADELTRVQRMAPAAPGLDDLQRYAATGVPDVAALAASLKSIAAGLKPVADAAAQPKADDSWLGWATNMLSELVTIRNAGDGDWAKTAEGAAALAESGDLAQAISRVNDVDGAKPPPLQQWLEQAQARVKLEATLSDVEAAVLRMLAAKG